MAKVNLSTLKTPYWKNARTKEFGEKARASYIRISQRGTIIKKD